MILPGYWLQISALKTSFFFALTLRASIIAADGD
jgi:hypothetical protein